MKITLIGGSGFVGTRLIDLLCPDGKYELQNIDKQPSHFFPDVTVTGDVRDREKLTELLKGTDVVVLLAAEHRDDVTPLSLYYDVNVGGMQNTLSAMEANGVKRIVFTSSVAVYGLNKKNPDEEHPKDPFNHYGKSKWLAEMELEKWYRTHPDWNVNILRPTVIFGERNRGNVYNLLNEPSMMCWLKEEELDYNALFNDKVYSMITTGKTAELLEEYEKKYSELVDKIMETSLA